MVALEKLGHEVFAEYFVVAHSLFLPFRITAGRLARFSNCFRSMPAELSFELPRRAVCRERLAPPAERVVGDLAEDPADRGAVRVGADLNDVLAAPAADQVEAGAADRVLPRRPPRLDGRIPHPRRGARPFGPALPDILESQAVPNPRAINRHLPHLPAA